MIPSKTNHTHILQNTHERAEHTHSTGQTIRHLLYTEYQEPYDAYGKEARE